jgi:Ser/Thr protein kinase RdoA (MazF antagonist)
MGPPPKHPSARRRTNRTTTAATLQRDPTLRAPKMPPHPGAEDGEDWHPLAVAAWKEAWRSPMAPEFVEADRHGMYVYLMLVDDFWTARTARQRAELAAEIRLSGQRFGFSPIDRRRLQWEVEKTEEAQQRGARRRQSEEPKPAPAPTSGDPRTVLRSIS